MKSKSFEDSIREKFEGQTKKVSNSVWTNIESALNAKLVLLYASRQMMYKKFAVAMIIIAVLMSGFIYSLSYVEGTSEEFVSYNALLSNNISGYYNVPVARLSTLDLSFEKIKNKPKAVPRKLLIPVETHTYPSYELKGLKKQKPVLYATVSSQDIHRYNQVQVGLARSSSKRVINSSEKKVWAGVEAEAGVFNSSFEKSGTMANSINDGVLAMGHYVNPTTNISEKMDAGMTTTIGVDFGVELGNRWTLESGIAYTNMENTGKASINISDIYIVNNNNFINGAISVGDKEGSAQASRSTTTEVNENFDHEVALKNNMQIASVPFKAGYYVFSKKFSLRLNAGFSANYLVDGNIHDPSKTILDSDKLNLYNDWSFDGVGGVELGYSIFNKFDLTIEPNYRYAIMPISNELNSPSRFALQTGLRYTLN